MRIKSKFCEKYVVFRQEDIISVMSRGDWWAEAIEIALLNGWTIRLTKADDNSSKDQLYYEGMGAEIVHPGDKLIGVVIDVADFETINKEFLGKEDGNGAD